MTNEEIREELKEINKKLDKLIDNNKKIEVLLSKHDVQLKIVKWAGSASMGCLLTYFVAQIFKLI